MVKREIKKHDSKEWVSHSGNFCRWTRARTYHNCSECDSLIEPKEYYLTIKFKAFCGRDYSYKKICSDCFYRF